LRVEYVEEQVGRRHEVYEQVAVAAEDGAESPRREIGKFPGRRICIDRLGTGRHTEMDDRCA